LKLKHQIDTEMMGKL